MSGTGRPGNVAGRQTASIHQMEGEMVLDLIYFDSCSPTSCTVQISGTCCNGFEIGWVNYVRVVLFYDHVKLGEVNLQNTIVIPDSNDRVTIPGDDDFHHPVMMIRNMGAFRALFEDIMPKKSVAYEAQDTGQTKAALSVSPDGFGLTMTINLARMPRMRCDVTKLEITGNDIRILFKLTNFGPLRLPFEEYGNCRYALKKDGTTVGKLRGDFTIELGEDTFCLKGSIRDGVTGMATLKGVKYEVDCRSWQHYVLRSFETEVDLGETRDQCV